MPTEEEKPPTIEQAIDTAIADATPPPLETHTDDAEGGEEHGTEDDPAAAAAAAAAGAEAGAGDNAGDPPGEGSGDPGATEGGKPGAADAKDKGGKDGSDPAARADADGKDKKPAAAAAADAGDPGKKGPKQPDPVNDPLPEELKGKTRARMTSLIDTVKTTSKELEEARGETDGFLKAIAETGADPEGFARHVEVLRLMNSAKPEEQRLALKALRGAADRIAKDLGETEPGKELEGHQDLVDEVEAGDITKARAIEIATARNAKKAQDARTERDAAAAKESGAEQQAITAARTELNDYEVELRKSDPLYDRKRQAIESAAKALIPTIHPSKWKAAYKRLYDSVDVKKLPPATPRVGDGGRRLPAGSGDRQPMRPKQGAGAGGVREPKSISEAIDFGLEQAAHRR